MLIPTKVQKILRQDFGRFDHRTPIGPARWPHHDLLWIHDGVVSLRLEGQIEYEEISAPGGLLIFAGIGFSGASRTSSARASITHFTSAQNCAERSAIKPPTQYAFQIGAMVDLSQRYAREGVAIARRVQLLSTILQAFRPSGTGRQTNRVDTAWNLANARLRAIRGLADVAAQIGVSESTFRDLHRRARGDAAGAQLTRLRLQEAERLLLTGNMTVADIAVAVGYSGAGSLTHAFTRARGSPPSAHRRAVGPFA
jgi:AraC-like DNA-binding protein